MRIEEWVRLAKRCAVAEFTAQFPNPFLMTEVVAVARTAAERELLTVDTQEAPSEALPYALPELINGRLLRVAPIVKSNRNPLADRIFIGRASNTDIVLQEESVSKVHAHFELTSGGRWTITDAGSRNGTRLAGQLLEPHAPTQLKQLHALQFGRYRAFFVPSIVFYSLLKQRVVDGSVDVAV